MTFNYSKLRGRIIEKFGSQGNFSKALDMSEHTLSVKLNSKRFFTQVEISNISKLLDISIEDIPAYFFQNVVQ